MSFYLGIDGGGTKTRCVVGDRQSVLGSATSGGSNLVRLGEARTRDALHAAIRHACTEAKISPQKLDAICIGASGAGRPEVAGKIRAIIAELHPGISPDRVQVVGDTLIALESAFSSGPGVIAISGTGSIAFGRSAAGHTARAGGWGFAVSDEGSGQWIGRQAISRILRARDEQKETVLSALILDAWKLADFDALIQFANSTPPPEFPRLFPIVLRSAQSGDLIAADLLSCAAAELARLAAIVLRQIATASAYVPVAMTGSVFRQSAQVRRVFYNTLNHDFPGIEVRESLVEPALGALALARAAAHPVAG